MRYLVLPGHIDDSCAVLDRVWELCGNEVDLSVMNQCPPQQSLSCPAAGGNLHDRSSMKGNEVVLDHADELGLSVVAARGTVSKVCAAFDATGVTSPAGPTL